MLRVLHLFRWPRVTCCHSRSSHPLKLLTINCHQLTQPDNIVVLGPGSGHLPALAFRPTRFHTSSCNWWRRKIAGTQCRWQLQHLERDESRRLDNFGVCRQNIGNISPLSLLGLSGALSFAFSLSQIVNKHNSTQATLATQHN